MKKTECIDIGKIVEVPKPPKKEINMASLVSDSILKFRFAVLFNCDVYSGDKLFYYLPVDTRKYISVC